MMRSLYSAVSGLKTHQTKMDVIGNNIANVNTIAFKSTSVNFNDVMYQTTQSASGSNALTGTGGTNAKQIGLGVTTASMKVSITSEGAAQTTGEALDLKISGDSFFIVNNGGSNYFTRDGSFYLDGEGNLCMASTGYNVMGWQVDAVTGEIKKDTVSALRIKSEANLVSSPEATSQVTVSGVLDANSTDLNTDDGYTMSVTIYDDLGYSYTAKFAVTATPEANPTEDRLNVYTVSLKSIIDSNGNTIATQNDMDEIWGNGELDSDTATYTIATGQISNRLVTGYKYLAAFDQIVKTEDATAVGAGDDIYSILGLTSDTAGVSYSNITYNSGTDYNFAGGFTYDTTMTAAAIQASLQDGYTYDGGVIKDPSGATCNTSDMVAAALGLDASSVSVTFLSGTAGDVSAGIRYTTQVAESEISSMLTEGYYDTTRSVIMTGGVISTTGQYMTAFGLEDGYSGVKNITYESADSDISDGFTYSKSSVVTAGYHLAFDADDGSFSYINYEGEKTATLNLSSVLGNNFSDIEVDFSTAKNYDNSGTSTLGASRGVASGSTILGTGRVLGAMTGISVNTNGMIYGSYDNGDTILLGQIAVAVFANASGLESLGNNCYAETLNSGSFDGIGTDVTADGGSIATGQLEMSNVDLSSEFTNLITTQRGFQANSRIITTSDTMLEELINLKR